jgi:hypothetical protein
MYPNIANTANPSALLAGASIVGVLFLILVYVAIVFVGFYIWYRVMKAAVRNGTIEALKKTGYADELGHRVYAQTYTPQTHPAAQPYGAPLPPTAQQ